MICKYSCQQCGIVDQSVEVPARSRAVDVVLWVEQILAARLATDHDFRSPKCPTKSFQDVKIPIDDGIEYVGQEKK